MHRPHHLSLPLAAAAAVLLPTAASADVILSTDFTGRTVSGNTASNISYTTNGLTAPSDAANAGSLTADVNLKSGTDTGGYFVPDINTDNAGTWSTTFDLTVGGANITISNVVLDGAMFNSSSQFQDVSRNTEIVVDFLNSSNASIGAQTLTAENSGANRSEAEASWLLTYDSAAISSVTLLAGQEYDLVISTTNASGTGNFTGLDSFTVNGTVIPEPASLALLAAGGLCLLTRQRKSASGGLPRRR